jgi:hypothetical protein
VYNKPTSGPLGSSSAEGQGYERQPFTALRGGGACSVEASRRNAGRADAVEDGGGCERQMSKRPAFEWIGYTARGKTGLADR